MSATGELLVTAPPEFRVNVAEYRVARERGIITTFGLGSCIAIMLYDAELRIVGAGPPPDLVLRSAVIGP
jgi:hypothetical protein